MSMPAGSRDGVAACEPHVSVTAWSIDSISAMTQAVAFYQRVGLHVSHGGPDAPFTTLRAGEAVINLRRAVPGAGHAGNRVILRVRGVDALYRDLLEKGLKPTQP